MIKGFQRVIDRLEGRLLAGSSAITIVSRSWALDLDSKFRVRSKVHVITNGYDPEDLTGVTAHQFGHFAIVYAGIFYPPERVITPVLMALKQLDMKNPAGAWCFHYYGDQGEHVREEARRLGVTHRVKSHGLVPRSEALSAIKGANIAVVIASVFKQASEGIRGWIPGKLFEIIGLGTPILLIAPPGGDVESIVEPSGQARRFTGDDVGGIVRFIEELMSGSRLHKKDVEAVTWNSIAKRLDGVLRGELVRS
jgi:glycosyltransferase involved in cell wall biosynthesis